MPIAMMSVIQSAYRSRSQQFISVKSLTVLVWRLTPTRILSQPIRRYSDLLVHRAIRSLIKRKKSAHIRRADKQPNIDMAYYP